MASNISGHENAAFCEDKPSYGYTESLEMGILAVTSAGIEPTSSASNVDTPPQDTPPTFETDESIKPSRLGQKILALRTSIENKHADFNERFPGYLTIMFISMFVLGYIVYFGFAMYLSFNGGDIALLVLTLLSLVALVYFTIKRCCGHVIGEKWRRLKDRCTSHRSWKYIKWVVRILCGVAVIVIVCVDARNQPYRLVSFLGIAVFPVLCFIFSKSAKKVPWLMFFNSVVLQFVFGLVILRWNYGFRAFLWLGDTISAFIFYSDYGAIWVFGPHFVDHFFAMVLMPPVIYVAAVVQMLYYFGILQYLIVKIGGIIEIVLDVGPAEAFVAAANIFVGPNNSILTIADTLDRMTPSELHCVCASGFATVTGALFAAYIGFGVSASHLIAASLMSAPAAVAVGKMLYPETDFSELRDMEKMQFSKQKAYNMFDAFQQGALLGLKITASIVANIIAFVALLEFANSTLSWFVARLGYSGITFQYIFGYLFWPIPFLMGIPPKDCLEVGKLIGIKLFLTDILGYEALGQLIRNREQGLLPAIDPRSEVIATYALCGFGNFPDVGICLGAYSAIAPKRRGDFASVALRAMVAGNIACFTTACIAGLLYTPSSFNT